MPPKHRLIELPTRIDPRGALSFAQQADHIPFDVKRLFVIYEVPDGASRGGHAHREQHQFLLVLSGRTTVTIDDGRERRSALLDRPSLALYVPPMLWLELEEFSAGAICMVLASDIYQESDYIRDRAEFLRLTS
jgi:dTDP-4-dehydrorhamnose 3,5-epimerase-like enzyme